MLIIYVVTNPRLGQWVELRDSNGVWHGPGTGIFAKVKDAIAWASLMGHAVSGEVVFLNKE